MAPLPLLCALTLAACSSAPEPAPAAPPTREDSYEATLTRVLEAVVTPDGLVRYDVLATTYRPAFDSVLMAVETMDPARLTTDAEKLAFFLNAYNVRMLKHLLDAPAVTHLERDNRFDAFFKTPVRVARHDLTLNQLENGVLRRQDEVDGAPLPEALRAWRPGRLDPRLHVGLNCAAVSCPPLRRRAFTAENVDEELDAALREFVAGERFAGREGRELRLSSLLDWFGADFETGGQPLGDFFLAMMPADRSDAAALRTLLAGKTAAQLRAAVADDPNVAFHYDWTVNRAR
ncbi:MAG TPA: DUF547 domain-containing protein [Rubricoccaceae bacterium]|nr:DUF547 domain-containing protein [Rubricoccaceae bacterium]